MRTHFLRNVVLFVRGLRSAGFPVSTASTLDALAVLGWIDWQKREHVRAALQSVLVRRAEEVEVFDQAFSLFFDRQGAWHDAGDPGQKNAGLHGDPVLLRLAQAFWALTQPATAPLPTSAKPDGRPSWSAQAALVHRDFADMTEAELTEARRAIARLKLGLSPWPIRRSQPVAHKGRAGRFDFQKTLQLMLRQRSETLWPVFREKRRLPPPMCVLCDISGSMSRYTEVLLRFCHTLFVQRRRVEVFLLGTELHRVTRLLVGKDIDLALRRVAARCRDFGGGTLLATTLHDFNRRFSRRVLSRGGLALLITDGLDRDDRFDLGQEAQRLSKSVNRLIFCNPLLGFEGFAPKASGIRAILPHAHEFLPIHNLESLSDLCQALSKPAGPSFGQKSRVLSRPRKT